MSTLGGTHLSGLLFQLGAVGVLLGLSDPELLSLLLQLSGVGGLVLEAQHGLTAQV